MKYDAFIFFGRPGSGKGTQVALLLDFFREKFPEKNILRVEAGDILRKFAETDGYTQGKVAEIIQDGRLVPSFLINTLAFDKIVDNFQDGTIIFFDGFCRRTEQAVFVDQISDFYGYRKLAFIYLDLEEQDAIERLLLRQRSDDNMDAIKVRLSEFDNETFPSLDFFDQRERYDIIRINAKPPIKEIHNEIVEKVISE